MEILKLVLPCERKSSALEKKWKMKKFHFPKIERPGFGGVDALRHFTKMMLFLEMLYTNRHVINPPLWGSSPPLSRGGLLTFSHIFGSERRLRRAF